MPMPYENFNWRPNDNSATTNLRYTLEAEKWVNAVSSAQRRAQPRSISGDLAFIGMVIQLILCVVLLIVLGILQLIKALVQLIETGLQKRKNDNQKEERNRVSFSETITEDDYPGMNCKPDKVWTIKKEKVYPSGWQLIFWNSYGGLRVFWQFVYLFIFVFIVEVVVLYLLSLWIPNYVSMNKEVLIFAGGVSLWNAFLGAGD